MPTPNHHPATLFFRVQKLKSALKVLEALRHNKRTIQAELHAYGNIDPTRSRLNYCLEGCTAPLEGYRQVLSAIRAYNANHCGKVRHDAVVAIEALFSVPAISTNIDTKLFFDQCLAWCKREFSKTTLISADVHMDESNPHMHVLMCCITPDYLVGSSSVGFAAAFNQRNLRFFQEVANPHGLSLPSNRLNKRESKMLAKAVKLALQRQNDPLLRSKCHDPITQAINANPVAFAIHLGIDIVSSPKPAKKMRTVAQIFTSKGKGSNYDKSEAYPV